MMLGSDGRSIIEYETFEHQVGGHHVILRHPENKGLLIKPTVPREILFYNILRSLDHDLLRCMPSYYGNWLEDNVILEDLTFGMERPCLLDIKIGKRLYDIDATYHKVIKRIHKSETSSSGLLGFRLCGLKTEASGVLNKGHLSTLNEIGASCALSIFFGEVKPSSRQGLKAHFLTKLNEILQTVRSSSVQLISSSVLMVYDSLNPDPIECRIIDFAHSHHHSNDEFYDDNYVEGLEGLIRFIDVLDV